MHLMDIANLTKLMSTGLDDDYGNQVRKPSGGGGLITYQQALQKAQKVSAPLCCCRLTPSSSMREEGVYRVRLTDVRGVCRARRTRKPWLFSGTPTKRSSVATTTSSSRIARPILQLSFWTLQTRSQIPVSPNNMCLALFAFVVSSLQKKVWVYILQKMTVFSPPGLVVCGTRRLKHLCGRHLDCHVQGGNVALGRGSQGVP